MGKLNASVHFWLVKSNSINLWEGSTVIAEMYLPSGDQWGEKSPLEPGNVETLLDLRSMM